MLRKHFQINQRKPFANDLLVNRSYDKKYKENLIHKIDWVKKFEQPIRIGIAMLEYFLI